MKKQTGQELDYAEAEKRLSGYLDKGTIGKLTLKEVKILGNMPEERLASVAEALKSQEWKSKIDIRLKEDDEYYDFDVLRPLLSLARPS
ncbi:MAG: hypothetical protein ACREBW_07095 [Candidatus Micrarchaeaceae archaeon]